MPLRGWQKLIAAVLWAALFLGRAEAQSWIDDNDWSSRWGVSHDSYIVSHRGESLVRERFPQTLAETFVAEALAVVVPAATPDQTSSLLQRELASSPGVRSIERKSEISLEAAWRTNPLAGDSLRQADFDQWRQDLDALGVRRHPLDALRIRTKPYNQIESRDGFSEATFLLFDGRQLFGTPCTVLLVYRTDRAKQWGLENPHSLFSFGYKLRTIDLVTSTERKLLDRLRGSLHRDVQSFPVPYARSWYASSGLWTRLKAGCQG